MSEIIKTVFVNYVICAVLGGVLEYLTPERFKKTLRIAVVSLMVFSLFSPFLKDDIKFEGFSFEEVREEERLNALMHIANLTEKKVRSEIKAILIKNNIDEYEIYIDVTPDEETNTVYLDKIKIEIGEEFKSLKPKLEGEISDEYKPITEVGVKNE